MAIRDIVGERCVAPVLVQLRVYDQQTTLRLPLAQTARASRAVAREQWADALAVYCEALKAFRRADKVWRRAQSLSTAGPEAGNRTIATQPRPPARTSIQTRTLPELTPRERDISELVARGFSNRDIAQELVIEKGTV